VYQYYNITLQGTDSLTLTYKLEEHRPAQIWAGLISNMPVSSLRPSLNPWQGFNKDQVDDKVNEINNLIVKLNEWLPNKIQGIWDKLNHQESANRLHVHFPEQEKTETDLVKRDQLTRYNDLIHELEELTLRPKENRQHLLLCPDGTEFVPLEDSDYKLFKPSHKFGDLRLGYCHVGRHPFELYSALDIKCPEDQIVPQHSISAYHTLRFYDNQYMDHWHKARFYEFYNRSTLKNIIKWNDSKMAFGYITLGKLEYDGNRDQLVEQIGQCNKVIGWNIY